MRLEIKPDRWRSVPGVMIAALVMVHACGGTTAVDSTVVCTPDETLCGGSCAALQKDPQNCGACGTVCGSGTVCSQGECAVACGGGTTACGQSCADLSNDRDDCGACGLACSAGHVCEGGQCTSTCAAGQSLCVLDGGAAYCATTASDNENCGACGVACGAGHVCADGVCGTTCAADQTFCAGDGGAPYCANTKTDNANCGACGVVCQSGELCKAGSCGTACSASQTFCSANGGYCASTASDPANCGGCGASCGTNQICLKSVCTCAPSFSVCFGSCVSLSTDDANCGSCGVTCAGTCEAGRCVVTLASNQSGPFGMAVDSSYVYWANDDYVSGGIQKVLTIGGTVATLAPLAKTFPLYLAVDTSSAYVAADQVYAIPLGGGTPTAIAGGLGAISEVRVDPTYAYFVAGQKPGGVYRVSKTGGTVTTLATSSRPNDLAVDTNYVYWSDPDDGTISRVPLAGGAVTTLVSGTFGATHLVMDAANLYWIASYRVMQAPITGGTAVTLYQTYSPYPMAIAVDNTHVYWTSDNADLMSIPIGGGTPVTLTSGERTWEGIAVDSNAVYFDSPTTGQVKKVTPKK